MTDISTEEHTPSNVLLQYTKIPTEPTDGEPMIRHLMKPVSQPFSLIM